MRNCLSTSAIIIEKNIIEKYRYFDENLQSSQDYDLWLKISSQSNPSIIKKFVYIILKTIYLLFGFIFIPTLTISIKNKN